jgi:hypothetical protein
MGGSIIMMSQEDILKLVLESIERTVKNPKFVEEMAHGIYEGWQTYLKIKYNLTPKEYAELVSNTLVKETRE